jgi:hypothetical protein
VGECLPYPNPQQQVDKCGIFCDVGILVIVSVILNDLGASTASKQKIKKSIKWEFSGSLGTLHESWYQIIEKLMDYEKLLRLKCDLGRERYTMLSF